MRFKDLRILAVRKKSQLRLDMEVLLLVVVVGVVPTFLIVAGIQESSTIMCLWYKRSMSLCHPKYQGRSSRGPWQQTGMIQLYWAQSTQFWVMTWHRHGWVTWRKHIVGCTGCRRRCSMVLIDAYWSCGWSGKDWSWNICPEEDVW